MLHSTPNSQSGRNSLDKTPTQFRHDTLSSYSPANNHSENEFEIENLHSADEDISFNEDLQSSFLHSTPKDQGTVYSRSQTCTQLTSDDPKFDTYLSINNHSEHQVSNMSAGEIVNDEMGSISLCIAGNEKSRGVKLRSFDIKIPKLIISNIIRNIDPVNGDQGSITAEGTRSTNYSSNYKCFSGIDGEIFDSVFSRLISRVSRKYPVNRREILARMVGSTEFNPVLLKLREHFSNQLIEKKVINRVRTSGIRMRPKFGEISNDSSDVPFMNVSKNSRNILFSEKRNRSIFLFKKDEHIFLQVFIDLIKRVADKETLNRCDIIRRMKHPDFVPVMERLTSVYSDDALLKLISIVRTVGLSMRNK